MRDEISDTHPITAINITTQSDNTAIVGNIIDRQGFDSVSFVILPGTLADADATFTLLVEHGDAANLSDAAAVADQDLIGTEVLGSFTHSDSNKTRKIGYIGGKRYTRITVTPTNNTGSATVGAICLLENPSLQPTANPPM